MQNKSKFNTVLLIILIVLVVIGIVYVLLNNLKQNYQNNSNQTTATQTTQANTNVSKNKASTITNDPRNPNVSIYTSYSLGVQFSYLKDGGFDLVSLRPIESGDKISFIENNANYTNPNNYIRVFQQLPNESTEQTIQRVIPESFKNQYCTVTTLYSNEYIIWDKRIPLSYYGYTSLDGTPYQDYKDICPGSSLLEFFTDPVSPGVVYYVSYESQSPSYWADVKHTKQWWQTVHLIAK